MNQTIRELFERKSVRVYQDRQIEAEKKKFILESALQAPTAGNMMLYSIIDVTKQELKDKLAVSCDNQPFIAKAPFVLIFVADYQKWYDSYVKYFGENVRTPSTGDFLLACEDTFIAAQNAVAAAESMGIGSCYIGDIIQKFELHKEILKLPKYTAPVCMLCFGYPTENQKNRKKPSRFDLEYMVFENEYKRIDSDGLRGMFEKREEKMGTQRTAEEAVSNSYRRKWSQPFTEEMTRSVKKWIDSWEEK